MSFVLANTLVQNTIRRLRQITGTSTQLYSNDEIYQLLKEQYRIVRAERWWDHLMTWADAQLNGITGSLVAGLPGLATGEAFQDIKAVYFGNSSTPLPQLTQDINPYRLTGTYPRFIEPTSPFDVDNTCFRVWPLTSVTTVDRPLRVHYRADPADLFDPAVTLQPIVPFDESVLVNMAAARYLAQDGTNPGAVEDLNNSAMLRLEQLRRAHDRTFISLDPRNNNPVGLTEWTEDR